MTKKEDDKTSGVASEDTGTAGKKSTAPDTSADKSTAGANEAASSKDAASKASTSKESQPASSDTHTSEKNGKPETAGPGTASKATTAGSNAKGSSSNAGAAKPAGGSNGSGGKSGKDKPPKKKGGAPQWLVILLVILVVLLLLGLGFNLQRINSQHGQVERLEQRVDQMASSSHQSIQEAMGGSQQSIDQLQQRADESDQTMKRVLDELNRHQQTDPREWTYAEVDYLLRIANQRLSLERDVPAAEKLLHTADERLASTNNPAFVPVRRAISSELGDLDSVQSVDSDGTYLALASAMDQAGKLPLAQDTEALKASPENPDQFSGGWRQQLARLGDQLKDLVTVRHHDKPLEALITPKQEGYLRENVRLQLEQAQFALLRQDQQVFTTSLGEAQRLIKQYYRSDNDGVSHLLSHLDDMANMKIHPELPDISGSLETLRNILAQRSSESSPQQGE